MKCCDRSFVSIGLVGLGLGVAFVLLGSPLWQGAAAAALVWLAGAASRRLRGGLPSGDQEAVLSLSARYGFAVVMIAIGILALYPNPQDLDPHTCLALLGALGAGAFVLTFLVFSLKLKKK